MKLRVTAVGRSFFIQFLGGLAENLRGEAEF